MIYEGVNLNIPTLQGITEKNYLNPNEKILRICNFVIGILSIYIDRII